MTGWLIDTSVLSELAPTPRTFSPELASWLEREEDRLFLSVISIVEIRVGIEKVRRSGGTTKVRALETWLAAIVEHYSDRILPIDTVVATRAGQWTDQSRAGGDYPGFADTAIAATADVHALTVVTRNLKHFRVFDVPCLDPAAGLPT